MADFGPVREGIKSEPTVRFLKPAVTNTHVEDEPNSVNPSGIDRICRLANLCEAVLPASVCLQPVMNGWEREGQAALCLPPREGAPKAGPSGSLLDSFKNTAADSGYKLLPQRTHQFIWLSLCDLSSSVS